MISLRRAAIALTVLTLTAACGGGGAADPDTAGDAASPSAAPGPAEPVTLPVSASGRAAVFSHGPRTQRDKTVALTFDADMTADQEDRAAGGERFDNPGLISTLRAHQVPATVFMTGMWARTYPDQVRAISRSSLFEVAGHSYSHYAYTSPCYGLPRLDPSRQRTEVEQGFDALRAAGVDHPVPYFRFPGGCYDASALRAIAQAEVTAVQWDVASGDPFNSDPEDITRRVLEQVRPGSVVVMHCTLSAAPATEEAVKRIVPELRERGYRLVKVSDLIASSVG